MERRNREKKKSMQIPETTPRMGSTAAASKTACCISRSGKVNQEKGRINFRKKRRSWQKMWKIN
jgi:hypothetical protein